MKLLGWMQRKLRPSNIEPFKDFTIGKYCTCLSVHSSHDDRDTHPKSTSGNGYGSRYSSLSQQETEDSFTEFEGSHVISGRFHGFLTIGTLGSQRIIDEPVTPTFTMYRDNMTEERTEVTEKDSKRINDELGRFLEAEGEEQGSNQSSGRNSLVSTITLSGKPIQEANAEEYGKTIIPPLEGYLFGSSVEVKKEKVFNNTKIAEEIHAKQTNKHVKHLIKKILKKFHASSGSSTSFSTKKNLQKVIKVFHKKIHPENPIGERESKMNNGAYSVDDYIDGDKIQQAKDNMRLSISKAGLENKKITSKLASYGVNGYTAASENGEHWINTDADYLVLEL